MDQRQRGRCRQRRDYIIDIAQQKGGAEHTSLRHAIDDYQSVCNPCPIAPAFMINDAIPLESGTKFETSRKTILIHTLNSEGGTEAVALAGASEKQLMSHGMGKSKSGLKYYLPKTHSKVPKIISHYLA